MYSFSVDVTDIDYFLRSNKKEIDDVRERIRIGMPNSVMSISSQRGCDYVISFHAHTDTVSVRDLRTNNEADISYEEIQKTLILYLRKKKIQELKYKLYEYSE